MFVNLEKTYNKRFIPREKHWGVLRVYGVDGHVT